MTPARLVAKDLVRDNEALAIFTVAPFAGEAPAFEAGQFTRLAWEFGGEVEQRSYSIASAPERRDALEFYIVDTLLGRGTSHLFSFPLGHPLWIAPPVGKFTLERHPARHLALVGSGTGVAPYVSMLRHLVAAAAQGRPVPESVSVWHGVRHSGELAYFDEFRGLEARAPFRFRYLPCVSRHHEDPNFDAAVIHRGRVNEILALSLGLPVSKDPRGIAFATGSDPEAIRAALPLEDSRILLCGNPAMIESFAAVAADTPWAERLAFERWW